MLSKPRPAKHKSTDLRYNTTRSVLLAMSLAPDLAVSRRSLNHVLKEASVSSLVARPSFCGPIRRYHRLVAINVSNCLMARHGIDDQSHIFFSFFPNRRCGRRHVGSQIKWTRRR